MRGGNRRNILRGVSGAFDTSAYELTQANDLWALRDGVISESLRNNRFAVSYRLSQRDLQNLGFPRAKGRI